LPLIDIHCHILPGIDDGPADLSESLVMARLAAAAGTRVIVASPHVQEQRPSPGMIAASVATFNAELIDQGIALRVVAGAENAFHLGLEVLSRYPVGNSRYLLIEFPHTHLPLSAAGALFELINAGLQPIIVHPERNPSIINEPQLLFDLVKRGALVQLTAGSLTGDYGAAVRKCARYLLKQGVVDFLASDAHSSTRRIPDLRPGLKAAAKLIGKERAQVLVRDNPQRLLTAEQDLRLSVGSELSTTAYGW
jgi:protein-tyrosine phosphatase